MINLAVLFVFRLVIDVDDRRVVKQILMIAK